MDQPFLAMLMLFAGNFAPRGWAQCNGQTLAISQNSALFSLLGTTYGGNGVTTFGLPDLRGRVPIHAGQGPGLSSYSEGEIGGVESVTLLGNQLPAHNHPVAGSSTASSKNPNNAVPAFTAAGSSYGTVADLAMSPTMVGSFGGNQPHTNVQPYLALIWCIALEGIYPSRN